MGKLLWVSSSNQVSNFSRATLASSTLDIFTWKVVCFERRQAAERCSPGTPKNHFYMDVWLTTISQVKNLESSSLNNHFKVNVSGSRVKSNRDKKRISKFYSPEKQKANATENRPYPKRKGSSPKHRFSGASREFQAGCTHLQSRFDTCLPCLGSWPLWKNLL